MTAIVWFRNDLRILDSEALFKARFSSNMVLPVYCVDPRLFQSTYHFGFPKLKVYAQRETYSKEVNVKNMARKRLRKLVLSSSSSSSLSSKDEFVNPNSSKIPMLQLI
ncbi:hypothetical protein Ddye_028031 [Dipteronia dyeriana]|uniref:Photolyase/cryptochrome alpha/beta domain-containing protein n=1 Tax=Dipteronia dyeriana TaxID=168575 RepID=A0AAD9TQX0_9ROSI|nr:hypothetical protein Ddye_028031 [Dipteronia dyeriana]